MKATSTTHISTKQSKKFKKIQKQLNKFNIRHFDDSELVLEGPLQKGCNPIILEKKEGILNYPKDIFQKDIFTENNKLIRRLLHKNGCVILKGFNISTFEEYEAIFKSLKISLSSEYRPGIAPRTIKSESGMSFSSTEASKHISITPHNEMAYSNYRPKIIAFWCKEPPTKYGETPLFNCRKIYNLLEFNDRDLFHKVIQPIIFKRKFTNEKSAFDQDTQHHAQIGGSMWKTAFNTTDKIEIERYCDQIGMNWKWTEQGELETNVEINSVLLDDKNNENIQLQTPLLGPAVYEYMKQKFPIRFDTPEYDNVIAKGGTNPPIKYNFSDENTLTDQEVTRYMNTIMSAGIMPKWEKGDVWILDNVCFAHGRMNIDPKDSQREIVASLGDFFNIKSKP